MIFCVYRIGERITFLFFLNKEIAPVDTAITIELSVAFVHIGNNIRLSDQFESDFAIIMRIFILYVMVLVFFVGNIAVVSPTGDYDHQDNEPHKNNTIEDDEDDGHHNSEQHDHDNPLNKTIDHHEDHDHHDQDHYDPDHHDHDEHSNGAGATTYSMLFFATTAITSVYGLWI